jgi:TolA-binding protein
MKPTFHCSECQNALTWGEKFCGNCGRPVEWPTEAPDRKSAQPSRREKKETRAEVKPAAASWKMMVGFALFLVAGVIILELATGTKNIPVASVPQAQQQPASPAANMQAMGKLNELEQIANASPNDLKARLDVANFAHDNRFYDKAIESYKIYLEKKPNDPDALVDIGICYNDEGNLEEARKYMEKALKVSPKHLLAHFNLGIVSLRGGDLKGANDWFKKVVAISPNSEIGQRAQQLLSEHLNAGQ